MKLKMALTTVRWKSEPQREADCAPGFDFLERWNNVDVRFPEERATIEDPNNIAVHLLRNAFGGSHRELLAGRLVYQAPVSRNVRDDITIRFCFSKD